MSPAEEIIERLLAVFGEPNTANTERFIEEYRRALTGIAGEVLSKACDRVIRDSTFWPKPAEIIQEASHVAAQMYSARPTDWDSVEAERRKGWSLADLNQYRTAESIAYRNELVAQMKRNISAMKVEDDEVDDIDWKRGQRDGFLEMQRNSPNKALHMRKVVK